MPALKRQDGGPLRLIGSLSLVRSLIRLGLVDRLRLLLFPQILDATGEQRVYDGLPDVPLDLITTRTLDGRLVLLEYARSARPSPEPDSKPLVRQTVSE
jgi:dihydrofolate reductase